jgi:ribosome-associated protein
MSDDEEAADERPSKSALKRHSHDLQELGETLIELPDAELEALPLPEKLRDAVLLARRITKHGGLYRQRQYIGKLMRQIDAEPIRTALTAYREAKRRQALQFRRVELWRSRLVQEGDPAVNAFMEEFPAAERSIIARLAAQARHERDNEKTPKATRELFSVLRELMGSN